MKIQHNSFIMLIVFIGWACNAENTQAPVARVGETVITQSQVDAYLKFKKLDGLDEERRKKAVDGYLSRQALAQAVDQTGLLDDALVAAELNEFKTNMLIGRYLEKFLAEQVTDQAVESYYNSHAEYEELQTQVAHIMFKIPKKMSPKEQAAKLTKAKEALTKLRAGADFSEIAKTYSEDRATAQKGGDIGWIKQGSVDPALAEAVFAMKVDEVSEPIKTAFGYHIAMVTSAPKKVKKPLKAVQGDIRETLRVQTQKDEMERLKAKVQIKKEQ